MMLHRRELVRVKLALTSSSSGEFVSICVDHSGMHVPEPVSRSRRLSLRLSLTRQMLRGTE